MKRAERLEDRIEERWRAALRVVLATPEGRFIFGDRVYGVLARSGLYRSPWSSSAQIHYLVGRQDFGRELLDELLQADEDLYQLMEREAREVAKRDAIAAEVAGRATADTADNEGGES